MTLYEDGALDVVCTALRSSPSHAGVQFTGCSAMSNLARTGTWLHVRQCVRVCVCVCLVYIHIYVHTPKFIAELLVESIVEQGAVDLLCSSLSAYERHQGVQAVALRTRVLLTEDGKAVCVRATLPEQVHGYMCDSMCACMKVCMHACVHACMYVCVCVTAESILDLPDLPVYLRIEP